MKYHALFVSFEKKQQNLKLSSAVNCRWRFMGKHDVSCYVKCVMKIMHIWLTENDQNMSLGHFLCNGVNIRELLF